MGLDPELAPVREQVDTRSGGQLRLASAVSVRHEQLESLAGRKLDLPASANDNRRVHAVLTYLQT
jgi:hypothetical protein